MSRLHLTTVTSTQGQQQIQHLCPQPENTPTSNGNHILLQHGSFPKLPINTAPVVLHGGPGSPNPCLNRQHHPAP
ncbi:rCG43572, partial [Rattus norvegicus]